MKLLQQIRQWVSRPSGSRRSVSDLPGPLEPARDKGVTRIEGATAGADSGSVDEVESQYRKLLEQHPDDSDLLLLMGTKLGQRGEFAPAIEFLDRALQLNPADASAYFAKGNCLRGLRRDAEAVMCYDKALALRPEDADAWFNRGAAHRDRGIMDQALLDFGRAISLSCNHAMAHQAKGELHLARKEHSAAADNFRHVLRLAPGNMDACFNLGVALNTINQHEEALACFERVVGGDPANPSALASRAQSLSALKRHEEALASLDEALRIAPGHAQLLVNRGAYLLQLGHFEEALAALDKALTGVPDSAVAHYNRGSALEKLQRHGEALQSFERALVLEPGHLESLTGHVIALHELQRSDDALAAMDRALALRPEEAQLHVLRARILSELQRPEQALTSLDQALTLRPEDLHILFDRAKLLTKLARTGDAIASYGRVLSIDPDHTEALFNRGYLLLHGRQGEAAAVDWARLARIAPGYPYIQGYLLRARMHGCDWQGLGSLLDGIRDSIEQGKPSVEPLIAASALDEPRVLRRCAEIYVQHSLPAAIAKPAIAVKRQERRTRVGYMAGEFRNHAVTFLTSEIYERHDRNRFEVIGLDNGYDDGSSSRKRIERAFDDIVPIARLSDEDATAAIQRRGIDILVDLNGHTGMRRSAVLSRRPAPVQVNWLGFPGTMGATFMDYILADSVIIPPEHEIHYSEKVVRLPDTYQPNDSQRAETPHKLNRSQAHLPAEGFVFCCFNDNAKIMPDIFSIWMRLLLRVPGSVLWLREFNEESTRNLRAEAAARGVAPDRLVFAPVVAMDDHQSRHHLADLFLDTLPYNAHTTASDALWAGLPLLTCLGSAYAGRVAASLLCAAGLPELVTRSLADYEALAIKLASSPELLAGLRARLAANRLTCALFDAGRFTRHIEAAYIAMHERALRGEPPAGFDVASIMAA